MRTTDLVTNALDLRPFCSRDKRHPNLMKSFTVGDFSFASDGVILVRVPFRKRDRRAYMTVDVDAAMWSFESGGQFIPFPDLPNFKKIAAKIGDRYFISSSWITRGPEGAAFVTDPAFISFSTTICEAWCATRTWVFSSRPNPSA